MQKQVSIDPYTAKALKTGCDCCHARLPSFHAVDYYLLPSKLMQKRHRDQKQMDIYCFSCFDKDEKLPILIDGQRILLSKKSLRFNGQDSLPCIHCGSPIRFDGTLYGMFTGSLWVPGFCVRAFPWPSSARSAPTRSR